MKHQQAQLINALSTMQCHFGQVVDEDFFKEIVQTVRACGFDVQVAPRNQILQEPMDGNGEDTHAGYQDGMSRTTA